MKLKTIFVAILLAGISYTSIAQVAIDPTGKRFMKPRERTKYGGPVHGTLKLEKDSVNITFLEIQIDPADKGGLDITARGTKTSRARGCDDCTVAGRIILNGKAANEIESAVNNPSAKIKQAANAAASRVVTFKSTDDKQYAVVTNHDGGFMMTIIPNGTYSIWVGGKKVVTDFVLTEVAAKEPEVKQEEPGNNK